MVLILKQLPVAMLRHGSHRLMGAVLAVVILVIAMTVIVISGQTVPHVEAGLQVTVQVVLTEEHIATQVAPRVPGHILSVRVLLADVPDIMEVKHLAPIAAIKNVEKETKVSKFDLGNVYVSCKSLRGFYD